MYIQTDYLKSISEEIAANQIHLNSGKANHHLVIEARRLEKELSLHLISIDHDVPRNPFHFCTLDKLVRICDQLFEVTNSMNPDVLVLIDLLTTIRQVVPNEIRPNLKLPKAFIAMQKASLAEIWDYQCDIMSKYRVNNKLCEIAAIPFKRFTEGKDTLYWRDFTWLKAYQAKLDILDWDNADCRSPAEALMSLLIGRDFNDDRFYIYCKKYIEIRTKAAGSKRNKLLAYAECEKLVLQDTQIGVPSFDNHANSVSTRLIKWIREEIDFVETHERERPLSKFEFKWNVETIAFFFKLLWDHKVFGKVSLEPLSEQIAANCSSVGKDEFQATTIFSRFYVKDREVLVAVEKVLSLMLEDVRRFL